MDDLQLLHRLLRAEANYQLRSKDDLWYRGQLRFLLHEAQRVIYDSYYQTNDKETVILASRRFGKSFLGVILCLEFAIRNTSTITRFIPPEIKQAWQILMPTMMKLESSWPTGLVRYVANEKAWRIGQNSWLYLGGFDSQKDAQRGGEASLIVCDEAGFTNGEEYNYILKSVLKPQLLITRGRIVHLSSPSREPDHPFLQETVTEAQLANKLHRYTIYDNPMLTAEDIESAKRDCGGEHTFAWRTEYLCQIVRDATLMVVPCWSPKFIGEWEPETWHYRVIVGDMGGVTDKTVLYALACDYDVTKPRIWVLDERVYEPNTTTRDIAQGFRELTALWMDSCTLEDKDDVAYFDCPGQTQVDLQSEHKLSVKLPIKDNFHAGIGALNDLVSASQLWVHKRCTFAAMSLNNGRLNERRTDYMRTEALGHCDGIAALIYGIRHINTKTNGKPPDYVDREMQAYWKQEKSNRRRIVGAAIAGRMVENVYRVT